MKSGVNMRQPINLCTYYSTYTLQPRFLSQPPDDLRKSNFFNFTLELRTGTDELVDVSEARFLNFLNESNGIRNGVKYAFRIRYTNGAVELKNVYLTLIDASTLEPIKYEGHDDNPKMQRVLLTHEAICTRCSLQKSCGNKNEAPSDPLMVSRGVFKFFLKCNQNCLKGAGNPRDMRRFAIAVSFDDITNDQSKICAVSTKIFVHNNSKHNRKRKREAELKVANEPTEIAFIHPKAGVSESEFAFYSKEWCRQGVSFKLGEQLLLITSIIHNACLTLRLPRGLSSGTIVITVCFDNMPAYAFPYVVLNKYDASKPGFLILYKPFRGDCNMNVEDNNDRVFVFDPPSTLLNGFQNNACSSNALYYCPKQNYYSSSTSQSPESIHLSGSDSSPTYLSPVGY